ncbi:MAG TPA: hypothetical protein VFO65_01015, partial [Acidimicrobiales bacterium]|nr:hypothetical protein [Acidimicrobiales bacterium]
MAADRPRPLTGFTVGVTGGAGQWEQARLFRSLGARVVPGFATAAVADDEADRRAALALVRAAGSRALDAVTFAGPVEIDALFVLAASSGGEPGLRWALG